MTGPRAVIVSYRLGGADGVGVEAAKWEWALRVLGFSTRRVAGEIAGELRHEDTRLPFLAIAPPHGARTDPDALAAALADADLVVVENLCSLPLNPYAATTTKEVLAAHRGRVCFHHHDFAWERPHLRMVPGFPPDRPNSLHVTISEHARTSLTARGIDAQCIPNSFDFDAFAGRRDTGRRTIQASEDDIVLLQPTRAIPRKNFEGGLRVAEEVQAALPDRSIRYWITGPAEDGYDAELAELLATSTVPVDVGRTPLSADAYAAADLVVFPSTWEGFGNPIVESVAARRMVTVGWYPALDEIAAGLDLLSVTRPSDAVAWLTSPDPDRRARLEENYRVARARFAMEHLPARIRAAFAAVGWTHW